jgi:hypothetical protein
VDLTGKGTVYYHCAVHFFGGQIYVGSLNASHADLTIDVASLAVSRPALGGLMPDPLHGVATFTLRNEGGANATHAIVVIRNEAGESLGREDFGRVLAGESRTVTMAFDADPTWDATLHLVVDPENDVTETHETNNAFQRDVDLRLAPVP